MSAALKILTLSCAVLATAAVAIQPTLVNAQSVSLASNSKADILPAHAVSSFVSRFGVPVIVGDKPISPQLADVDPDSVRLLALDNMTRQAGATWRKVYRVTPAASNAPVTTVARAAQMVDEDSPITLSVTNSPAADIERLVAHSDDAAVSFPDGAPKSLVTLSLTDVSISDAIADIAEATHTHWLAVYYVAPADLPVAAPQVAAVPRNNIPMTYQEYEEDDLFNGPFFLRTAPPQPVTQAATPATGADQPNQAAPGQANGSNEQQNSMDDGQYPMGMTPAVVDDPYGYSGLEYAPSYSFGGTQIINPFQ